MMPVALNMPTLGYPRKAGHLMTSTSWRHGLMAFSRPGQGIDFREHCFKKVRKLPPEKPRCGRRTLWGTAIEVMEHRPHLVAPLRQASLMVMELRQSAIAAFDG